MGDFSGGNAPTQCTSGSNLTKEDELVRWLDACPVALPDDTRASLREWIDRTEAALSCSPDEGE